MQKFGKETSFLDIQMLFESSLVLFFSPVATEAEYADVEVLLLRICLKRRKVKFLKL